MVAPVLKTGTVSVVLLVHKAKIGTQPPDHAVAQPVKTGTVPSVFHVLAEDNGTPSQEVAPVLTETGTDSHVFNVQLDKDGTHQHFHVHVLKTLSGMVFHA